MAEDFRLETDFFRHLKTRRLEREFGAEAVLALLKLFAWVAEYRPDGILLDLDQGDLEEVCGWHAASNAQACGEHPLASVSIIQAFSKHGFIEEKNGVYTVHEWAEHQPWVASKVERSDRAKKAAEVRWAKQAGKHAQNAKSMLKHQSSNAKAMPPDPSTQIPVPLQKTSSFVCPEPKIPDPPQDALIEFSTKGKQKTWHLTESLTAELASDFETTKSAVLAEARQALAWFKANPEKKKTTRGMRRFLTAWLAREADKGNLPKGSSDPPNRASDEEYERRQAEQLRRQRERAIALGRVSV